MAHGGSAAALGIVLGCFLPVTSTAAGPPSRRFNCDEHERRLSDTWSDAKKAYCRDREHRGREYRGRRAHEVEPEAEGGHEVEPEAEGGHEVEPEAEGGHEEMEAHEREGELEHEHEDSELEHEHEAEGGGLELTGKANLEVASVLLGVVAFVISLMMIVNWSDDDIRRYSWSIISDTTSIFMAVLMFGAFTHLFRLVDGRIQATWAKMVIPYIRCFMFVAMMQLTIGYISGSLFPASDKVNLDEEQWVVVDMEVAANGETVDELKIRNPEMKLSVADIEGAEISVAKRTVHLDRRKRRMKAWAKLFAHLAGFSAIAAGGKLQQYPPFSRRPILAAIPVVITQACLVIIFKIAKEFRAYQLRRAKDLGGRGRRHAMCEEEVEEAENDVASLSMSFLFLQAVRFQLSNVLPDEEGQDYHEHTAYQIFALYGLGILFGIGSIVIVNFVEKCESRITMTLLNTCSMCFAWSFLYATEWQCRHVVDLHSIFGHIVLATEVSIIGVLMVFGLDFVGDMNEDAAQALKVIRIMIVSVGILVGFSWERSFEMSVGAIASKAGPNKLAIRVLMCIMVTLVILPAWRRYILAKALTLQELGSAREACAKEKNKSARAFGPRPRGGRCKCSICCLRFVF